jgi:hypothetical protein
MKSGDKPTLPMLTASQLKALLVVASDSRLGTAPASDASMADVEALLTDMSRATGGSRTGLLEAATRETASLEELRHLKDLAKGFMTQADDRPHREAARLLYHVAVVAAFTRHGAAISGRPMHRQLDLYGRLAQTWAGHPIGELFRAAVARVAGSKPPDPR